jgi:hypothetical protein
MVHVPHMEKLRNTYILVEKYGRKRPFDKYFVRAI